MLISAYRSAGLLVASMVVAMVVALAVPAGAVAEPAVGITGGSGNFYLVTFDTAGGPLTSQRRISGLTLPDYMGLTLRPATGGLIIAMTSHGAGAGDTVAQAYDLDFATAVATPKAAGPFSSTLTDLGLQAISVNPVTDELRMTSASGENVRASAATGAFIANDTTLSGGARGPALAYDRPVVGATATTAWGIDTNSAKLTRIGGIDGVPSPDGGLTTQVGPTGIGLNPNPGFAISPTSGVGYTSNTAAGLTNIHSINFATGAASAVGSVDGVLLDLALLPPSSVQVGDAATSAPETGGAVILTVTRAGDLRLPASVQYATANDTATAGADFIATSGALEFPAAVTTRTVHVPLLTDAAPETPERFRLVLSGAAGAATLGAATTTVTITETADTVAPIVLALPLLARSSKVIGKAGVLATYSCSEACSVTAKLLVGATTIGVAKPIFLPAAGRSAIRVKPSALGQKRLVAAVKKARTHRVKIVYVLTVTDPSGNRRTVRLPLIAVR
ncbi:MAG: Na-Ca exchanger/integrin-beta4 [Thermoleophilia bacterium]|nr:Na-Ca exchanger/integrin-beta4 [Thermoleophilia bacterium]